MNFDFDKIVFCCQFVCLFESLSVCSLFFGPFARLRNVQGLV